MANQEHRPQAYKETEQYRFGGKTWNHDHDNPCAASDDCLICACG
jgi:hypothetical protein